MTTIEQAARDIAKLEEAAEAAGRAIAHVQELEDARPAEKSAAIQRLMATTNPETLKPHSASSAERVVELDPQYAQHRQQQAAAEVAKWRALGQYEAAKLTARLAVECVALEGAA